MYEKMVTKRKLREAEDKHEGQADLFSIDATRGSDTTPRDDGSSNLRINARQVDWKDPPPARRQGQQYQQQREPRNTRDTRDTRDNRNNSSNYRRNDENRDRNNGRFKPRDDSFKRGGQQQGGNNRPRPDNRGPPDNRRQFNQNDGRSRRDNERDNTQGQRDPRGGGRSNGASQQHKNERFPNDPLCKHPMCGRNHAPDKCWWQNPSVIKNPALR